MGSQRNHTRPTRPDPYPWALNEQLRGWRRLLLLQVQRTRTPFLKVNRKKKKKKKKLIIRPYQSQTRAELFQFRAPKRQLLQPLSLPISSCNTMLLWIVGSGIYIDSFRLLPSVSFDKKAHCGGENFRGGNMWVFYMISLPLTVGMVIVTLKYFAGPWVPRYVFLTVGYTWFCSLSIIILVPADIWMVCFLSCLVNWIRRLLLFGDLAFRCVWYEFDNWFREILICRWKEIWELAEVIRSCVIIFIIFVDGGLGSRFLFILLQIGIYSNRIHGVGL